MNWNILNPKENFDLITEQRKFLKYNNDNFIDVAFMKRVVNNVYGYYQNIAGKDNYGKCDDLEGFDHMFLMREVNRFENPKTKYILDIDLDFFTEHADTTCAISKSKMKRYLSQMKELGQRDACVGITLALEPDCCGSEAECLKICESVRSI
jgi:hypothetical protein